MRETEIGRGGRVLRVRDAGDPGGNVVMYFHGTPGSRLDLCFGEQLAADRGVRLVSFDRPGYGGSTPAPFGLASVAADAHAVADGLGVARFAALGMSGGGPGALAAATVPGSRVTRAGIASGAGPFQLVPGALDHLDDNDRAALSLLPGDRAAAAAAFAAGFEPLAELSRETGGSAVASAFGDLLSPRDSELLREQRFASAFADTMHEALRQGTSGGGWDNVSWIGDWDIDLSAIRCPVLLWYGSDDRFAPPAHGLWLSQNLPHARLVLREGEGHLGINEHLGEMLDALTEPRAADPASAPNRSMDMDFTRLRESDQYRRQRAELRVAELDLIDHVERVAALRRKLPTDTVVDDYELVDVASGDRVRLSELFSAPDRALVLYHFMYGKAQTEPCPLCTMWIDGYNAAAPHVTQNIDFAVVAAAEPAALSAHAASRGWNNLRLLSAGGTAFKYDLGSEEADGTQTEWVSVFTRAGDGTLRHVYSKGAQLADDRRERGIDLLSPVWHLLDLTPHGRGDWYPSLNY